MSIEERFRAKFVEGEPDECWLWNAGVDWDGYGQLQVDGASERAHRLSYELNVGSIPNGLHVLHRCDVTGCVNPGHLFIGTNAENMADRDDKRRQARGEKNGRAKLSEGAVRVIRRLRGRVDQRQLAKLFGVSDSLISQVQLGKKWRETNDHRRDSR